MKTNTLQTNQDPTSAQQMFRPPIVRSATKALDRSLFTSLFKVPAARIADPRGISKWRNELIKSTEVLRVERVNAIRDLPSDWEDKFGKAVGDKILLLEPKVKLDQPEQWSEVLRKGVEEEELQMGEYDLKLDYNHWNYIDIMRSVLPEDAQDELPVGFTQTGQVAHLNIRDAYLQYKYLIAQVLMDKNPGVKTVINKIDEVGAVNPFRTFSYEVLAGPDDLNVEIKEEDCIFKFDFAKVYWNSRLSTEHRRLVNLFEPGSVVVDVMAGIGPFAVPAGKRGVFVWANDLNPDSVHAMRDAIKRNKVDKFVRPYNEDGHKFIHQAAKEILELAESGNNKVSIPGKPKKVSRSKGEKPRPATPTILEIPKTISHFVMNLPASALTFIPSFRGLYAGREDLFTPESGNKLPMVHVHCFSTKSADNVKEGHEIAGIVSEMLGHKMEFEGEVQMLIGDTKNKKRAVGEVEDGKVRVHEVRDVAPKKRMFCASFRLPAEVAFAPRP